MNDALRIIMAVGIFVLLALMGVLIVFLIGIAKKLEGVFVGMDRATDPAIIQLTDVLKSIGVVSQVLKAMNIPLSYNQVATCCRAVFDALDGLTDGETVQ